MNIKKIISRISGIIIASAVASAGCLNASAESGFANITLAEGEHIRWIDRLSGLPDYAREFYELLEEASDNDGYNDYLIDLYSAPKFRDGSYGLTVNVSGKAGSYKEIDSVLSESCDMLYAVYLMFDRDHPEVFWLNGWFSSIVEYNYEKFTGNGYEYSYSVGLCFKDPQRGTDCRAGKYREVSAEVLKSDINRCRERVDEIISGTDKNASDREKIIYFNNWLTTHNSYNRFVFEGQPEKLRDESTECISALTGSVADNGPVCEGYARAFKVLCDAAGIPCVLESGIARQYKNDSGVPHMWNLIELDGKWYAADVTWNDPLGNGFEAVSGYESTEFLFCGNDTVDRQGLAFSFTHVSDNIVMDDIVPVTNGPKISSSSAPAETELRIVSQPANVTVKEGGKAQFTVSAKGDVLKYQWQYSTDGGNTWKDSTMGDPKTSVLSVEAAYKRNGYKYRCKVTSGTKTVTSDAAKLTVNSSLAVTGQPASVSVEEGKTAKFTVKASGTELKYQWQYSTDGGNTWKDSTMGDPKTAVLSVEATAKRNGYCYRCKVTSGTRTVTSSAAKLTVKPSSLITGQPVSVTVTEGRTAKFTVTASGSSLKYQWQFSTDGGKTWKDSTMGNPKTATLSVEAAAKRNGYQYRCIITSGTVTVTSSAAKLTVK